MTTKDTSPEARAFMASNPQYAYEYAYHVLNERFPEGEKVISTVAEYAYLYAVVVLKERFVEGERAINSKPSYAKVYYALTENKSTLWYHRTTPDRLNEIKKNGLKINSKNGLTVAGEWSFEYYKCRPIFLSQNPDNFNEDDAAPVLIGVNIEGLPLVADLPSLVDFGANIDEDEIWFEDRDRTLSYKKLVKSGSADARYAIKLTKSAACLIDIPTNRLQF